MRRPDVIEWRQTASFRLSSFRQARWRRRETFICQSVGMTGRRETVCLFQDGERTLRTSACSQHVNGTELNWPATRRPGHVMTRLSVTRVSVTTWLAEAKLGRSVRVLWTRSTANWKTRFQKSSSRTQVQFSLVEFTCCEQTLARDGCKEWPLVQWPTRPLPYGPRRPLMKINKKNLHYSCQNRIFTPSNSVR